MWLVNYVNTSIISGIILSGIKRFRSVSLKEIEDDFYS